MMTGIETLTMLINQQVNVLEKLQQTLSDEYELLKKNDFEKLDDITQTKLDQLSELYVLEQQQVQFSQTLQPEATQPITLKSMLIQLELDNSPSLASLVEQLNELAQSCDDQNKINGMMIQTRRNMNQKFLSALQQQADPGATPTYGRNGEAYASSTPATSVEA